MVEGNAGTVNATFTVTLSAASTQTVTVTYATADGTATAGNDYVAVPAHHPDLRSRTNRQDRSRRRARATPLSEANETFLVNLSNPTNAVLADAQGRGHHHR